MTMETKCNPKVSLSNKIKQIRSKIKTKYRINNFTLYLFRQKSWCIHKVFLSCEPSRSFRLKITKKNSDLSLPLF